MPRTYVSTTPAERLEGKFTRGPGCWEWAAAKLPSGYGKISTSMNQWALAHRVMWESLHGPIPEGQWVLHACDNPSCVKPAHLFLGTPAENTRDMWSKGRGFTPWTAAERAKGEVA